jgi:hypothetical protein
MNAKSSACSDGQRKREDQNSSRGSKGTLQQVWLSAGQTGESEIDCTGTGGVGLGRYLGLKVDGSCEDRA